MLFYDAVGRNIRVEQPDGTEQKVVYSPWKVEVSDEEDLKSGGDHEDTPMVTHLDALGSVVAQDETPDGTTTYQTSRTLDVQGNVLEVEDARSNTIQVQTVDMLGRVVFVGAADEGYDGSSGKGETQVLPGPSGEPIRTWKRGSLTVRPEYDDLRRPVGLWVKEGSASERLAQWTVFGEQLTMLPTSPRVAQWPRLTRRAGKTSRSTSWVVRWARTEPS